LYGAKYMKKTAAVILLVIAYILLFQGGAHFSLILTALLGPGNNFMHGRIGFSLLISLATGLIGTGIIYGVFKLLKGGNVSDGKRLRPGVVAALGLLFPGSAQACSGRWKWALFYIFLPHVIFAAVLSASGIIGVILQFIPSMEPAAEYVLNIWLGLLKFADPRVAYPVLWIISVAEGYRWASKLPEDFKTESIPGWRASVTGFGLVIYFSSFLLFLFAIEVGYSLKFWGWAKTQAAAIAGKTPPAVETVVN